MSETERIAELEKKIRQDAETYRSEHNRYAEDAVEIFDAKDLQIEGLKKSAFDFFTLMEGIIGDGFLFNSNEETVCPVCGRQPDFWYDDVTMESGTKYNHAAVCELAIAMELPREKEMEQE